MIVKIPDDEITSFMKLAVYGLEDEDMIPIAATIEDNEPCKTWTFTFTYKLVVDCD